MLKIKVDLDRVEDIFEDSVVEVENVIDDFNDGCEEYKEDLQDAQNAEETIATQAKRIKALEKFAKECLEASVERHYDLSELHKVVIDEYDDLVDESIELIEEAAYRANVSKEIHQAHRALSCFSRHGTVYVLPNLTS